MACCLPSRGLSTSGAGRMRAALLALSESLSLERDAHGFCGWEDLHFDQIPR